MWLPFLRAVANPTAVANPACFSRQGVYVAIARDKCDKHNKSRKGKKNTNIHRLEIQHHHRREVGSQVGSEVGIEVGSRVGSQVGSEVGSAVGSEVGTQVGSEVRT